MPFTGYCTRDDVFLLGLSAQAFVVRARPVTASTDLDITTGVVRLKAHGLTDDDTITLEVTTGGSLPTGLSAFVAYGVAVVSFDLFRITLSGVPITSYASAGSGWGVAVDPLRRLDRHILDTAGIINDRMTAYAPPFELDPVTGLYPPVIVGTNARLAAIAAATTLQFDNAQARVATDRLEAMIERDWVNLETYLKGRPVNPGPVDQNTVADNGPLAYRSRAPVAWGTGYL